MNWEAVQQFFRDNPRAWLIGAAAVLTLVLSVWGIWGGFSLEFGRFFAYNPADCVDGDCDNDGYINPGASCASSVQAACLDPDDSTETITGTAPYNQCPHICADITGGGGQPPASTPTPTPTATPGQFCDEGFWNIRSNEDWSPECFEGQSNINQASAYWVQANVDACHPKDLHLVWRADHRNKASCDPRLGATTSLGKGITTDSTGFSSNDLPDGVAGTARMTYDPSAFNCGSIHLYGAFWSQGQGDGQGWHMVFNYGKDCGGSTPPGPKPGAAVLKATCTGTTAKLDWNIPAGAVENVIQKNVNNAGWQVVYSDPTKAVKTFSETFVATTVYRHKSDPNVVSNSVQCPGGGAPPGPGTTVTPTPVYPPLTCAPINQTVALRQNATVTAAGGSGVYQWVLSGSGVQQGGTATSVDVAYTVSGQKVVRVSSGGQIATCVVTVTGTGGEAQPTLTVIKRGANASTGIGGESSAITINPNEIARFTVSITNNGTTAVTGLRVIDDLPPGMSYRIGSTTINGQAVPVDSITTGGLALDTLEPGANINVQWMATADATAQLVAGPNQSQPRVMVTATDTADVIADMIVTVYSSGFAGGTGDTGSTAGGVETGPGEAVTIALVMAAALTLLYSGYTRSAAYRRHEADAVSRDQGPMDFRS